MVRKNGILQQDIVLVIANLPFHQIIPVIITVYCFLLTYAFGINLLSAAVPSIVSEPEVSSYSAVFSTLP